MTSETRGLADAVVQSSGRSTRRALVAGAIALAAGAGVAGRVAAQDEGIGGGGRRGGGGGGGGGRGGGGRAGGGGGGAGGGGGQAADMTMPAVGTGQPSAAAGPAALLAAGAAGAALLAWKATAAEGTTDA